jgi:hypothetical protein
LSGLGLNSDLEELSTASVEVLNTSELGLDEDLLLPSIGLIFGVL